MIRYTILVLSLIFFFLIALPAEASFCHNFNRHQICIINIKRSAKNYWEYRVEISVDGVRKPMEIYNCRDRIKIEPSGTLVPIEQNDSGEFVCSFFKKSY